ncbi:SAM-dependent methyltransferase [Asaia sp. HN010]|uniref:tRNA1(Val) (adenine(37)-N6)-methyltransferase n=1 Tax=Asaia sp. HN010 TaxID=3081233 RepID=UPI003016DB41
MHDPARPEDQPSDSPNHMSGAAPTVNPATLKAEAAAVATSETMEGYLLDRRVRYRQFTQGYRTGIEPVLMAAFIPALPGQSVLEAGCGAGAGLLCLTSRCPDVRGVGLEADGATAQLAIQNMRENDRDARVTILHGSIPHVPPALRQLTPGANGRFHHAMANPPWHPADHTGASDARRRLAMTMPEGGWSEWITTLARWVLPGGSLTLALPAAVVDRACEALRLAGFGSLTLLPLWPKQGRAAKIVLLRAIQGGKGVFSLLPGLVLHRDEGGYTIQSEAILREAKALS